MGKSARSTYKKELHKSLYHKGRSEKSILMLIKVY